MSVVAEPAPPVVVGVVNAPVSGHSPSFDSSLDSLGSQQSACYSKLTCSVDELSPVSDPSLVSPRSDVTFDPSVTSVSPCSTKRTFPLDAKKSASLAAFSNADSVDPLVPQSACVSHCEQSSSSVDAKLLSESSNACQAHLVTLHPLSVALSASPCRGKRLRACKLAMCGLLFQNGQVVSPVQSSPVEANFL